MYIATRGLEGFEELVELYGQEICCSTFQRNGAMPLPSISSAMAFRTEARDRHRGADEAHSHDVWPTWALRRKEKWQPWFRKASMLQCGFGSCKTAWHSRVLGPLRTVVSSGKRGQSNSMYRSPDLTAFGKDDIAYG